MQVLIFCCLILYTTWPYRKKVNHCCIGRHSWSFNCPLPPMRKNLLEIESQLHLVCKNSIHTKINLLQELYKDFGCGIESCKVIMNKLNQNVNFGDYILFSDESMFCFNGHVTETIFRIGQTKIHIWGNKYIHNQHRKSMFGVTLLMDTSYDRIL